jgi:BNR repeat-like domain
VKVRAVRLWPAVVLALMAVGQAQAAVPITKVLVDPYTNVSSQHATAVEPDTFSWEATDTIVATAQIGRFFNGGASNNGFATSTDGGATWTMGGLPSTTKYATPAGPYDRVSDPAVAYDPEHDVWMISSLAINETPGGGVSTPRVITSRSTDGGLTWGTPVNVPAPPGGGIDKNWIACDTHAASPFYGNCYTTFDDFNDGDRLYMSTSTDGGLTWGAAKKTANNGTGLGGQPVVQPNGTVVVPAINPFATQIISFRSTDGGASWSATTVVSNIQSHDPAANLRSIPLPSAEVDGAGKVYVVWQDCRFRRNCRSNDIVMSTSTNGTTWSAVQRIPIDPLNSGVDHFIPGIAVDPATSGTTAKLGLTFYFYRSSRCGGPRGGPCQLEVGYVESLNGGSTWSSRLDVAGPFPVAWCADTSQGRMVGDYISTSWLGGQAFGAFAVAAKQPPPFDEAIYVPTGGLAARGAHAATSVDDRPVPGWRTAGDAEASTPLRTR